MISMNISPPRATADRNVDSVPNVNARILNSGSRNIGSVTRRSIITNAISDSDTRREQDQHARAPPPGRRIPVRDGCRT